MNYGHPSSESTYSRHFTCHNAYTVSNAWLHLHKHPPFAQLTSATHRFFVAGRRWLHLFNSAGSHINHQSSSACSNPYSPSLQSSSNMPIQNAFQSFASPVSYHKVFPFSFVSFHIGSSHSTLTFPLPCSPSTLLFCKSLGFLLLSTIIRCPNHLGMAKYGKC
jgi:hypothetical protein